MLKQARWLTDRLIFLSAAAAALGLLFEVAVILFDVVGRYFGRPLTGAQDMTQMAMVILVFGAMALCDRMGGHIAIDIFEPRFPGWFNKAVNVAAALFGAVIFLGIAWTVYESSKLSLMLRLSTNIIYLPKAYFQWVLCIFAVIAAIGMVLRAAELTVSGHDVRTEQPS
jgi:TRAP-type C4-dicarboxylate transport system permease small subunit